MKRPGLGILAILLAVLCLAGVRLTTPALAQDEAASTQGSQAQNALARDPTKGAVTNLPVPRYVTLKTNKGNARRGPGLSHRVDWVFTRPGIPLRVTAEYENWRRIEDSEGIGGWIHYTLLSGTRSVLVTQDMAEFRSAPLADSMVVVQAEQGVVGRLLECAPDWCRVGIDGYEGWVLKSALWGVDPGELIE
jgi:SH3-like domain-containing protein